jgi:hypothetical protein
MARRAAVRDAASISAILLNWRLWAQPCALLNRPADMGSRPIGRRRQPRRSAATDTARADESVGSGGFTRSGQRPQRLESNQSRRMMGDAPVFVEVGEAGIAVDHAMRRELAVQCS